MRAGSPTASIDSSISCSAAEGSRRAQVGDRLGAGDDPRALVAGGQEVGAPDLPAGVGQLRGEHDEGRQILVERAQAVADPRADAGAGRT